MSELAVARGPSRGASTQRISARSPSGWHDTRDASRPPTFERTLDGERFEAPLVHQTALAHLAAAASAEAILAGLDRTHSEPAGVSYLAEILLEYQILKRIIVY